MLLQDTSSNNNNDSIIHFILRRSFIYTYKYIQYKHSNIVYKSNVWPSYTTTLVSACPVSLTVFERYFSSINNPKDPFFTPDEDVIYFIERYERNEMDIMFQELRQLLV